MFHDHVDCSNTHSRPFQSYSDGLVSVAGWLVCWGVSEVWSEAWGVVKVDWWASVSTLSCAWNPWLMVSQWLAGLVWVLRSHHCWLDTWLHGWLNNWLERWLNNRSVVVQSWYGSLAGVWRNVDSVSFKNVFWNSTSASNETKSARERSWWVDSTHELSIDVSSWSNGIQKVCNDGSLIQLRIFNVMTWVVHAKVLVNPNLGFTILCKSDHLVSKSCWNNHLWNVIQAPDSVVKNNQGLLLVKPWDGIEQERDSFSKYKSTLLASTESETSRGKVGSNDLNPVGCSFSFVVNINFIIEFSVGLDIKVVKVSLLSFFASHDFVQRGSFNFFPFLWIVVELFGFWVMVSHFGDFLLDFIY